jgi:hypothetical protein
MVSGSSPGTGRVAATVSGAVLPGRGVSAILLSRSILCSASPHPRPVNSERPSDSRHKCPRTHVSSHPGLALRHARIRSVCAGSQSMTHSLTFVPYFRSVPIKDAQRGAVVYAGQRPVAGLMRCPAPKWRQRWLRQTHPG